MATAVTMPQLGESVTEGTVTRWLKNVGDQVEVDEPLVEVSTDKVDTEIPAPVAGVLLEIVAVEDDVVPVGAVLARVGDRSELGGTGARPGKPAPVSAMARPDGPRRPAEPERPGERVPVVLPELGESVAEGTVTRWLKAVGDQVDADEPLLEISTDKVDTEIPSPVAGALAEILVAEDETVGIGTTLGYVGPLGARAQVAEPEPTDAQPHAEAPVAAPTAVEPMAVEHPMGPASPLVRMAAREAGLDLAALKGTGPGGRITRADVASAAESAEPGRGTTAKPAGSPSAPRSASAGVPPIPPAAPPHPQTRPASVGGTREEPMPRLRRVIADRMVESLRVSAQLTTVVEIDLTRVSHMRESAQRDFSAREGVRLNYLPFFMRALVDALRAHPMLNASIGPDERTITFNDAVHLGVAVDTNRGLLVPVIHHAGDLTLAGLAHRVADLAERTRTGRVSPDDLSGGTFTVSNTGSRGSLFDTPIINQPQVGILGTGSVVKRPVVVPGAQGDDVIAIRSMAYFALTYDHRLVDGADAARFLGTLKERLETAAFEAELGL